MTPKRGLCLVFLLVLSYGSVVVAADIAKLKDQIVDLKMVEHGRYISKIAGCNDCHTAGYLMSEGKVPENIWLTGDKFGWRGPWGTTYGTNLRLFMSAMSEKEWVDVARTLKRRPPMPWFTLNEMHEQDLKAIYQFVKYLGTPLGDPAPAYLPPGEEPKTPFALFPSPPK
jgi:hypothetical protein